MTGPTDAVVTFLGHSTIVIDIDGVRILTDPILRPRVGPLVRLPRAIDAQAWAGVDVVLISHSHWDHLDYGSLQMIGLETAIAVPQGMGREFRSRGFSDVTELLPGEDLEVQGVRIEATHADHKGFGPPIGATARALGFLIHGSQSIYFAGDTAFFEGMAGLGSGIDLALIPVWGWGPTAKSSEHLDPQGAARAVAVIKPRFAVPIHWGTLHPLGFRWMRPTTRIDPPHQFAQIVRRLAPQTTVRVLPVGSKLTLPPATRRAHAERSGSPP